MNDPWLNQFVQSKHHRKMKGGKVTKEFLLLREERAKEFGPAKWIIFCQFFMENGCNVYLYEANISPSKYIKVVFCRRRVRIRFSNHKPGNWDTHCDFLVGPGWRRDESNSVDDAVEFTIEQLRLPKRLFDLWYQENFKEETFLLGQEWWKEL